MHFAWFPKSRQKVTSDDPEIETGESRHKLPCTELSIAGETGEKHRLDSEQHPVVEELECSLSVEISLRF